MIEYIFYRLFRVRSVLNKITAHTGPAQIKDYI